MHKIETWIELSQTKNEGFRTKQNGIKSITKEQKFKLNKTKINQNNFFFGKPISIAKVEVIDVFFNCGKKFGKAQPNYCYCLLQHFYYKMKMPNKAVSKSFKSLQENTQLIKTYNFFDQCCFRLLKEFNTAFYFCLKYIFFLFNIEHSLGIPHVRH